MYYDLIDDYPLIEASFLEQYGIRLNEIDMTWREFVDLLSCLSGDTPLGRIVGIRSETDEDIISQFNKAQRNIYEEWNGTQVKDIHDLFNAFR